MDGIRTLLEEAQAAGLAIKADGARLVIRGPKSAEKLATQLLARKAETMALLEVLRVGNTLDFSRWVLRRSHAGRTGFERPGLPEWKRWWARCAFEDLPVPPED